MQGTADTGRFFGEYMKQICWMVQAGGFYCLTLVAALMPAMATARLGAIVGFFISRILPARRRIVLENMEKALPFLKRHQLWCSAESAGKLAEVNFDNLGRHLVEICRLYHGKGDDLISGIELRGREHYEAARSKGKGMICFSGHCGNWELMALAFSRLLGDGVVIAKPQKNPYFNRMVERMRMNYNSRVIYSKGALRGILGALRKGEMVGILADQAASRHDGVLIEILGRKAWASTAPALIALRSGAPLLPVFIHREGERHVITFYPEHRFSEELSAQGLQRETQKLSRYVENFVAAHPTQWYWVHRRWKRAGEAAA
jgi:Kdo2-lipid IVA lauroyltransferase/acyltransferase